ncbi:MAG: ABC transporter ATP-binding protein [Anaerolineales bacterium]|nr:ABC transporter ATP-binding protein [Anaerolineales bacterium]
MLELIDIRKSYEGKPLLEGVTMRVDRGETVCLLGPSGGGKSTLLRIAAGLEQPESGRVLWNGADITHTPANRRGFGLMFQDYALFPHLSVAENVAFGLRMQNLPKDRIRRETTEALARVELAGFERRRTADLSGGEQQRVALARALAPRPKLMMFDEPLGALDRALREQLAGQLHRLLRELQIPALYVTHDQEEAFGAAQRIALLHDGRIVQSGRPEELIARPASAWAADFLGLGTVLRGTVTSIRPLRIKTALGEHEAQTDPPGPKRGDPGWLLLRPSGGSLHKVGGKCAEGFRGTVVESIRKGEAYRIRLRTAGGGEVICAQDQPVEEGEDLIWTPAAGTWIREQGK